MLRGIDATELDEEEGSEIMYARRCVVVFSALARLIESSRRCTHDQNLVPKSVHLHVCIGSFATSRMAFMLVIAPSWCVRSLVLRRRRSPQFVHSASVRAGKIDRCEDAITIFV